MRHTLVASEDSRILTILTFTEGPTPHSALIALTILLQTMRLSTLTAFLNLINLKAQTKSFLILLLLLILLNLKAIRVPAKRLDNGLFMFRGVLKITTIMTITALVTKQLFLKALAIEFKAL